MKNKKINTLKFLNNTFTFLPSDINYLISKYVGKNIKEKQISYYFVNYKLRKDKYTNRHFVGISSYRKYWI